MNTDGISSEIRQFTSGCSIVLPQGFQNSSMLLSQLEKYENSYHLRYLDGSCSNFNDFDCKALGLRKNLRHLILPKCTITFMGFEYLAKLPFVRSLDVQKNHLGPEVGKLLSTLTSITELKIGGCGIGGSSIMILAQNTHLRYSHRMLLCEQPKSHFQISIS